MDDDRGAPVGVASAILFALSLVQICRSASGAGDMGSTITEAAPTSAVGRADRRPCRPSHRIASLVRASLPTAHGDLHLNGETASRRKGGTTMLLADLHIHTTWSDGKLPMP